jgi:RNA polymerase sigma factor (TIGR02999 family)
LFLVEEERVAQSSNADRVRKAAEIFEELRASGKSSEEIFVALYADLKQLARMKTSGHPPGASIHATRLLSDLYVRLFGKQSTEFEWESARHFFNTMALAMEQLLIDHARQFKSRGRDRMDALDGLVRDDFVPGPKGKNLSEENVERALFIKELLNSLENDDADQAKARIVLRQAEIVRLRVFAGLAEEETAEVLGCSSETVTKEFRKAKAKLASLARRGDAISTPKSS